jgi:hypothetical protein
MSWYQIGYYAALYFAAHGESFLFASVRDFPYSVRNELDEGWMDQEPYTR